MVQDAFPTSTSPDDSLIVALRESLISVEWLVELAQRDINDDSLLEDIERMRAILSLRPARTWRGLASKAQAARLDIGSDDALTASVLDDAVRLGRELLLS